MISKKIIAGLLLLNTFFVVAQEVNKSDANGKKEGVWKGTYEVSKRPRYEGTFSHGKETGVFKFFDDTKELKDVSWFQPKPETSLDFIHEFHVPKTSKIIDIGGGDSLLVDHLLDLGYEDLTVFTDNCELAKYQIKNPINAGFQNSVIRSKVVQDARIPHDRIGEDRIFLLDTIIKKNTVGFIEDVLVIYNVHSSNISDTNKEKTNYYKSIEIQNALVNAYKKFGKKVNDKEIKKLINTEVNDIMFWHIAPILGPKETNQLIL